MTNNWYDYSRELINKWIESNSVERSSIEKVLDILDAGSREDRVESGSLQCPEIFCPSLRSQPWYDKKEFDWTHLLESNFDVIQEEFNRIYELRNSSRHPENEKLAKDGVWGAYYFYRSGNIYPDNIESCPKTLELLHQIPGIKTAGSVFFSTLSANSKIKPHYGPHNFRIRCHMGLVVPENCFISVGNIKKNWEVGKCIIFDDSFIHYVENNSDEERMILILDVWHPDFSSIEISLLEYMMAEHIKLLKSGIVLDQTPESVYEFV